MKTSTLVLTVFALLAYVSAAAADTPDVATVKAAMAPAQLALGDPVTNSIGMLLVPIPAGEFEMGSRNSDGQAYDDEEHQHPVTITKPFYLSVFETTQEQYEKVMGVRPWQGKDHVQDGPDYPATWVSWNDAVEFCRKLSEQEGVEYRLPTEAKWEYACRAGTATLFSFGDETSKLGQHAWYDKNAWDVGEEYAHGVGQKLPNAWGVYDMHGNVWEWCQNRYAVSELADADSPETENVNASDGRVLRGGSFRNETVLCRSSYRNLGRPGDRYFIIGFRVSRTYP